MIEPNHVIEDFGIPDQAATVDHALAGDGYIRQILAPDEAIMEKGMTAVLVAPQRVGFGLVIGIHSLRSAENRRASIDEEMNIAFEMNRAAQICARRNEHGSATGFGGGIDGIVNRRTVQMLAVANRTIVADIVEC